MTSKLNQYYREAVDEFDDLHLHDGDEHYVALSRTLPFVRQLGVKSILDVGCGTGRALEWYTREVPGASVAGIDPSPDMLARARERAPEADCRVGSAQSLPFDDGQFDLVCSTGILHHVKDPDRCIREMFRVSNKAVLISDHNNFAFGGDFVRRIRLTLYGCGILGLFTFVKHGLRRQGYSATDGYWYPYSLLNSVPTIDALAEDIVLIPTRPSMTGRLDNFLLSQSHLAIWATTSNDR